ncbi:MAG: hypothetical protein EOM25_07685 [Deltaproteobacteria bacterium]|nr:hypothetical protein [Deltaproteobacteria bacterium]
MIVMNAAKAGKTKDPSRTRILFVGTFLSFALLALWAKAYVIQIVDGPRLADMALRQHWASEDIKGRRGEIFDRQGRLLAKSVDIRSISACPYQVEDKQSAAKALAPILGRPVKDLAGLLNRDTGFVWLARKIGDRQAVQIRELGLPGIYLVKDSLRTYPQGHMAGQLIGFVGSEGQGLEGLELAYDEHLSPTVRKARVQRDASGHRLSWSPGAGEGEQDGQDLRLTLDMNIQFAAENALAAATQAHNARLGMCLVVHVPDGEILAWAQYPFFDPNLYRNYAPAQWKNRIANDVFEPGSTIKPFVAAAALEEKTCTPDALYYCEKGRWAVDRKRIKDTHAYEWLPVTKVIRYSSNIGMAKIGLDLGAKSMHSYFEKAGLTSKAPMLLAGQSSGLVRHPHQWTRVDLANASFGQGMAVTALQMARAYACLANDGLLPSLKLDLDQPVDPPTRVFSGKVVRQVLGMLQDAVQEDGTGTKARIPGIVVGGKTGTAQKAEGGKYVDKYLASFAALLPGDKPEYVVLVMIDEPRPVHYGGLVAAPAAQEIGIKILSDQGRLPAMSMAMSKDPGPRGLVALNSEPIIAEDPAEIVDPDAIPDLVGLGLHAAVEKSLAMGIVPAIEGRGIRVVRQKPAPGSPWPSDPSLELTLWVTEPGNS